VRRYVEIKDTSKPKRASVRFASTERDPAVNVISSSSMDLEPVTNCLKSTVNRMDKLKRREQPARSSTPLSRFTSPALRQSQNQRGRSSARPQNDNTGNRRVQFEDQQPEYFDDVPPQNHPTSPQPRRFQTPSSEWNDVNYQPPTQARGGAGPRFQETPLWWTNPGPRYGDPQSTPTLLMCRGNWSGGRGQGFAGRGQWTNSNRGRGYQAYGRRFGSPSGKRLSTARTLHHVQAPMRSHAQAVVEVGVVDVMCVGRLVVTVATTSRSRQQSSVATSSHGPRRSHQATGHKETVPGVRQRQPGSVTTHPPAVPVGLPLQSDRPLTSGPIRTRTPDGLRTSTELTDDRNGTDLTDVKTPLPFFFVLSTASVTIDVTTTDSVAVDATATAPYLTRFLATLNMLHVIAEGMAPNITVTIHSVQIPMMLDSGAQISVLPSDIAANFDPPISLPSVTREVRTFGNH